jgi:hypothetical protein
MASDLAIPDLPGRPILVTGMPRSGTTWVGRVLCAGNGAGYLNEPFNLATSPGTIRVPVDHWFHYVTAENEGRIVRALEPLLRFDYPLGRELRRCRRYIDLLDTVKMWRSFVRGRGRRPLVKEPHAVFSAEWFARRLASDVVVTVRHPAAVVSSWKRLDWNFDFANLLGQAALVRDVLGPFRSDMERALEPSHATGRCTRRSGFRSPARPRTRSPLRAAPPTQRRPASKSRTRPVSTAARTSRAGSGG